MTRSSLPRRPYPLRHTAAPEQLAVGTAMTHARVQLILNQATDKDALCRTAFEFEHERGKGESLAPAVDGNQHSSQTINVTCINS